MTWFAYPPDVPEAVRAEIERTLAEAELAYIKAGPPEPQLLIFGARGVDTEIGFRPEASDPVHGVLAVCETVLPAFCDVARDRAWSADTLRSAVDGVLDALIARVYTHKQRTGTLEAFTIRIHDALLTRPCWLALQHAIRERSQAEPPSFATQLDHLRLEAHWTVEHLAERVGLNKSNVLDHLGGKTTPRRDNLSKYEDVFSAILNRPVKLNT